MNKLFGYKLIFVFLFFVPLILKGQNSFSYPLAEKTNKTDNYFDTIIPDPYRGLEEANSTKTLEWINAEDKLCDQYSKKLSLADGIYDKLMKYSSIEYKSLTKKGKYYFHMRYPDSNLPASLYFQKSVDGSPKEIFTPSDFTTNKNNVASIREYDVSSDNKYLAVSYSNTGSDWCSIRVIDIDNRKPLTDKIENVKFPSIAWSGNGFFYVKCDSVSAVDRLTAENKNPRLYYHKVESDSKQDLLIYYTFSDINKLWFKFKVTSDEKYLIIHDYIKDNNDKYKAVLYAKLDSFPNIKLKPFILIPATSNSGFGVIDNIQDKFLVSTDMAASTKRIFLYDPSKGVNSFKEIIPPYKNVLMYARFINDKIICLYYLNGHYSASIFDKDGKSLKTLTFPDGCSVSGFNGNFNDSEVLYYIFSFYFPAAVYKLDLNTLSVKPYGTTKINFDHSKYETRYVLFRSADSVDVPMFLTYKKGIKLDGNNPTLLYAYGGFGISITPFFKPSTIIWIENGGVFAVPSIRGGGELGTNWHSEGRHLKKNNSFNDFICATKYLIENKYTNSDKLAIEGGSNGGLLIGVAMTQKPELFKVAIPLMGVFDMLRYNKFTMASQYAGEYGVSSNREDFSNLIKYSPLHNLKKNIKYPATLAITADNDDRVPPLHTYKFIATLQEYGNNTNPYIMKTIKNAGHYGSSILRMKLETEALKLAFIFKNLNVDATTIW